MKCVISNTNLTRNATWGPCPFAAVQLAFDAPRSRVLVFHTGRLVGTGGSGPAAARLSIMRAARQLALEADIHLHIRSFSVINQVGAASICARLDCDAFASTHSSTSHYDRSSFVGLAWRPRGESICCEIYSTGKANLPGSVRERDLLGSFSRLIPELIRLLKDAGRADIKVTAGGVIPQSDYQFLRDAGVQGIYGPGSNVVECAADMLRLLGHNMPPPDDEMDEAAE